MPHDSLAERAAVSAGDSPTPTALPGTAPSVMKTRVPDEQHPARLIDRNHRDRR